jgi:hypothetical protein
MVHARWQVPIPNCQPNSNSNSDGHSDAYAYSDTDTKACSDAEAASNAAAAPVALTGIVKAPIESGTPCPARNASHPPAADAAAFGQVAMQAGLNALVPQLRAGPSATRLPSSSEKPINLELANRDHRSRLQPTTPHFLLITWESRLTVSAAE